ncbi:MAB_1171c family putative transporter [Nocardia sp. NPDC050175]|uniref:MAB_1171c family putative transporter n=1 Tax=Nocardia sp. NPDC050175 TaxID=3364317 RepID=UPI0037A2F97E
MVTSSWPTALSLPLVLYTWILVVVRFTGFHTSLLNRRVNLALIVLAAASTMREPTLQRWLVELSAGHVTGAELFQYGTVLMGTAVGFNILTIGAAAGRMYRPVVVHSIAVATALVALIFGTGARNHGVPIEDETGWAAMGFWMSLLPVMAWLDYLIVRLGVTELRKRFDRRETLVYLALALVPLMHLIGFGAAPVAAVFLIHGEHNVFTALLTFADREILMYRTAFFAVSMTIPMVLRLVERLGLDSASRSRKQLLPLWSDLTAVCPEIVYRDSVPDLGSRFLLHRTVIEIRDCLRILSRYAEGTASHTGAAPAVETYAIQLAHACAARSAGALASTEMLALPSSAGDVSAETAELTALAAHWQRARALANLPERTAQPG